jgi:co-chaperonin GroES (HSP10)
MALKMKHAADPRKDLLDSVGDIKDINVYSNWILVAVYKRPEQTAGGILLTDTTRKEDEYQGKVGLVLKKGPLAFVDDDKISFHGQNVNEGDWIAFRVSDGWSLEINGTYCRILQDTQIRLSIPSPDVVF